MSTQQQVQHALVAQCAQWLHLAGVRIAVAVCRAREAVRKGQFRGRRVPVEVLLTDPKQRRMLERELHDALRRLERVVGVPLPSGLAVVVQQVINTDRQLAGCTHVGTRSDGTPWTLVRLAIWTSGQRASTDEVLAVLVEQCVALLTHRSSAFSVVPLEAPAHPALPALSGSPAVQPTQE